MRRDGVKIQLSSRMSERIREGSWKRDRTRGAIIDSNYTTHPGGLESLETVRNFPMCIQVALTHVWLVLVCFLQHFTSLVCLCLYVSSTKSWDHLSASGYRAPVTAVSLAWA